MGNMCFSQNSAKKNLVERPAKEASCDTRINHANSYSHSSNAGAPNKENSGPSKESRHHDHPQIVKDEVCHTKNENYAKIESINSLDESIQRVADEFIDDLIDKQIMIQLSKEARHL